MSLNLIFHMSDFNNLKIVNNIFFFILEGGLIFLSRAVYANLRQNKPMVPRNVLIFWTKRSSNRFL